MVINIIYPAQIDNSISIPVLYDNTSTINAETINRLRSAILAIENTLGVNPASIYNTVSNRLNFLETSLNALQIINLAGDLGGTLQQPKVVGLQGVPIATVMPVSGQVLGYDGMHWLPLTIILPDSYVITVSGPPSFLEIGEVLVNPIFDATYSDTPVTAVFSDSVGNPPENVFTAPAPSIPPDLFIYNQSYQFNSYPSEPFSVVFTLSSTSASISTPAIATTSVTWGQKIYYGTGSPNQSSGDFIKSLSNGIATDTKQIKFTIDADDGYAIYFAYRTAYGTADFWAYGWEGGFNLISNNISLTNDYGFTENYTLYQSDQLGLGNTTVYVF